MGTLLEETRLALGVDMARDITQIRKFSSGDLAVLKSGGPTMSVAAIADFDKDFGAEMIQCIWFGPDESLCSAAFPSTVLVKVEPEN